MQQFEAAQTLCPFKVVPVEERVYQLRKGHFIAYLPEYTTVNVKCRDGKASEMHLNNSRYHLDVRACFQITWLPLIGQFG
jgi:hypothetical protein